MDDRIEPRIIEVRGGSIVPSESWLYVWVDLARRTVVHVGGTAFDPQLRTYVHLTDDDPARGRVRAQIPESTDGNFDVLAFALPAAVDRATARDALTAALSSADDARGDALLEQIVSSVRHHLA
jgi:hypothetical protein